MAYRIRYRTRLRLSRCAAVAAVCILTAAGLWIACMGLQAAAMMLRDEGWYLSLARTVGQIIRAPH